MTRATARTPVTDVIARVHEGLGRARSRMVTATLDDAMAVEERPNMPATTDEWPNWRLALPQPIEALEGLARWPGESRARYGADDRRTRPASITITASANCRTSPASCDT